MKCVINGDYFTFNQAVSIQAILQELELDADRVIVQHNEKLVKQADFQAVKINDQDCLELLEFVGGG
ncbi:sulfur carrier protein ThiS [Staphylococcus saprophyticus]|uniref:sulfur carrier protein ThiS n=1 Tax=Staphylococcus saprophyticus TaxID=29385 RepID=UPI00065F9F32|nr:sulfur carrier protein ThiS [Staphylococcus saprophyticus]AMG32329.1 thiamine biosynthesis protein ThiS [Staphylococcus saprophyticus]MDW3787741.1 sulfur carrier protein ThiS [Staphylococcus saprophyticus]MDW3866396.1 sulfur carrier protein ThiS [Staphylococcus saprophyticus]MDW4063517.1 sulfur carrier protein ThiS [Staphylococcus saprophyticus]MDW4111921.1 sulfur carrier protein ThiS [Staphylococcus saprophyticus]